MLEYTAEELRDMMDRLGAPTEAEHVGWKVAGKGGPTPYIDHSFVTKRLNDVVGFDWSVRFEDVTDASGNIIAVDCYLTVCGSTRQGRGVPSNYEGEKGGNSDAFKRAAVKFGIGWDVFAGDHPEIAKGYRGDGIRPFQRRQEKYRNAQPAQDDKEAKLILWASRQGLNVDQLDRALGAHPSEFDGTGEDAVALVKAFKARVNQDVPSWVDEKPQRGKFYATLSDMAIEEDEFKQWANAASMREYATLDDALAELNVYVEYKLNEHVSDWNRQD